MNSYSSLEICAGAGGQALGLEQAGFEHLALVEIDQWACATLRKNRRNWKVEETDAKFYEPDANWKIDLLAGGVPCPPFSIGGQQLGEDDERDLFPTMLELIDEYAPRGVMIENVKGLLQSKFEPYRNRIDERLRGLGYVPKWRLLNAADYGVPQLRPRTLLIALNADDAQQFNWPTPRPTTKTVGSVLLRSMAAGGWGGAEEWAARATDIAPTLVGGSKKHGGADLGPTRAKRAWAALGVDGMGLADRVPGQGFIGNPRLTVAQAALLQGFPASWEFAGGKTAQYRQVGNAFPPPVARAVGVKIIEAFQRTDGSIA